MFKARMKFAKEGRAKYISHLDLMHAMQRSMARCQMPLWFTEGFNQHAYVSVALPLSTGYSGECEFLDFNITAEAVPENAVEALNDVFPEGLRAIEIYPLADGGMKVGSIEWSQYRITWGFEGGTPKGFADDKWMQERTKCFDKPLNIYEVHAGSWRQKEDGSWYTYAELADAEKDAISHRGRAMEKLEAELAAFLGE